MGVDAKELTRIGRLLLAALALATVIGGCARLYRAARIKRDYRAQAVLAAAGTKQINLFGELDEAGQTTYFTRTAVSVRQHTFTEVGQDLDCDVSADGQRMVFASTRHNLHPDLYIKRVDGVAVTQLTADPASDLQPTFSPDGSKVAFASNRSGNWDIWVIDAEGGAPVQITSSQAQEIHPSWSPDGSQLVYCSLAPGTGQWELWVSDAGAGFQKRFIGYGLFPEWSPVGDTIVFQRARERGSRWFSIWTITLVQGEPRYPTEVAAHAQLALILPTWSPDAASIACVAAAAPPAGKPGAPAGSAGDSGGPLDVWMMNADGTGRIRLTDGHGVNYAPVFAPDGRIFFTSNRSGHDNVWSLLPGGRPGVLSPETAVTSGLKATGADRIRPAKTAAAQDN